MTQKWPLVRLLSMARQVPASQQNASASPIDASKRHCSYDGAQMQIGCANHWLKMSGIPMIRTASETRDKMNNSVAVLMTRRRFGASSRS